MTLRPAARRRSAPPPATWIGIAAGDPLGGRRWSGWPPHRAACGRDECRVRASPRRSRSFRQRRRHGPARWLRPRHAAAPPADARRRPVPALQHRAARSRPAGWAPWRLHGPAPGPMHAPRHAGLAPTKDVNRECLWLCPCPSRRHYRRVPGQMTTSTLCPMKRKARVHDHWFSSIRTIPSAPELHRVC